MASQSTWRVVARREIDAVLCSLPAGTSKADQEKAVRAAYPFAERVGWVYKAWLKEVRAYFPRDGKKKLPLAAIHVGPHGVLCGWCNNKICLACVNPRQRWHSFAGDRGQWRRLLIAALVDADAVLVLADWLEENDWLVEAALTRNGFDCIIADRLLNMEEPA